MATTSALAEPSGWCPAGEHSGLAGLAGGVLQLPWAGDGSGSTSMAAASKPPRGTEGRAAATSDKDAKSPWLGPCGVEGHSHSDSGGERLPASHCVRLPCLRTNWRLRDMLRSRECSTGCRFGAQCASPMGWPCSAERGFPPPLPQSKTRESLQWERAALLPAQPSALEGRGSSFRPCWFFGGGGGCRWGVAEADSPVPLGWHGAERSLRSAPLRGLHSLTELGSHLTVVPEVVAEPGVPANAALVRV